MDILFKNARILSPGMPERRGSLLVRGRYIAEPEAGADFAGEVIDCRGKLLMPGFVNAHTHAAMTLFRGLADDMPLQRWLNDRIWPLEEKLTAEDVYWGTLVACAEMIRCGVTTFSDMYFLMDEVVRATDESGMRALLAVGIISEEGLATAVELCRKYQGEADGRVMTALGPHAEYTCGKELLKKCADKALELGCRLHIHVSETKKEHEECLARHGLTPIGLLRDIGFMGPRVMAAHCCWVDDEDIRLLAEAGASVLHCPISNLKLASGMAPAKRMLDAGVNVALGTDGAASNNRLDVWAEMRLFALLHKGVTYNAEAVTAQQAFAAATEAGAKALGIRAGRLEPGYLADIIMVDTDRPHYFSGADAYSHIVYGGSGDDVVMTMVGGKILYYRGEYTTLDIDKIRFEAHNAAKRLGLA